MFRVQFLINTLSFFSLAKEISGWSFIVQTPKIYYWCGISWYTANVDKQEPEHPSLSCPSLALSRLRQVCLTVTSTSTCFLFCFFRWWKCIACSCMVTNLTTFTHNIPMLWTCALFTDSSICANVRRRHSLHHSLWLVLSTAERGNEIMSTTRRNVRPENLCLCAVGFFFFFFRRHKPYKKEKTTDVLNDRSINFVEVTSEKCQSSLRLRVAQLAFDLLIFIF